METTSNRDGAEIVTRLRGGDGDAMKSFIRRHGPAVQAVAVRFLRRERDRNAAVLETFKCAFAAIEEWDDAGAMESRLHHWALEACLRRMETEASGRTVDVDEWLPRFDVTGHRVIPKSTTTIPPTPEFVRACVDRLPVPHRAILLLRDIEGLDVAETGRLLHRTTADVQIMQHQARQAVQALIARGDVDDAHVAANGSRMMAQEKSHGG